MATESWSVSMPNAIRPEVSAVVGVTASLYIVVLLTIQRVLTQVPPHSGFHIDLGLVGLISAVIGGAVSIAVAMIMTRRRPNDPAVDHLLAIIADLEEQLAARPSLPHHRKRDHDEVE